MSYRVHYRGILSSSSPAEISAWGSSASETTSGPGTDTASAKTPISVQAKTQSSRIINQTMACSSSWVHKHVTLIAYFDKIFYFKRQLPADVENVHTFSKDFYFSCRHALSTQKREMRDDWALYVREDWVKIFRGSPCEYVFNPSFSNLSSAWAIGFLQNMQCFPLKDLEDLWCPK